MTAPIYHLIPNAPKPVAPYSHVVEADGWLFVTGQLATEIVGVTVVTASPSGQSNDGVRVGVRPHTGLAALEDFPLRDPVARLRESFR